MNTSNVPEGWLSFDWDATNTMSYFRERVGRFVRTWSGKGGRLNA